VERGKAKTQCDGFLESDTYKKILRTWEEFLKGPEQSPKDAENSEAPIIELAKKHIWKKYSKVIKLGSKIHNNSPDPELHRLRIECKKLRYLLEFFTSLFPEKDIKLIIRYLKKLQDNLGNFNDLFVQQERLKNFLKQADVGYDLKKKNTQAAAGGLISVLYQKQRGVRKKFSNNFKEFSDKELSLLFEKLFFES
jgi:CHAD domain-containing protein